MVSSPFDYYAVPASMTDPRRYGAMFAELPDGVGALAGLVQGLLLHEHWAQAYGVSLSPERRKQSQIRSTERMLECLLTGDAGPLRQARPLERRLVCVCRQFAVLMAAMLRAKGVPARARCGFAAYFKAFSRADRRDPSPKIATAAALSRATLSTACGASRVRLGNPLARSNNARRSTRFSMI